MLRQVNEICLALTISCCRWCRYKQLNDEEMEKLPFPGAGELHDNSSGHMWLGKSERSTWVSYLHLSWASSILCWRSRRRFGPYSTEN